MSDALHCPVCGTELNAATLFAAADAQQAFARLAAISIPLGARVLAYLALFAPAKQRLTLAKQIKLLLQILPDLERESISLKGRDWSVTHVQWAAGIDKMLASRDAGQLELPMQSHRYLYAILAGLSDRTEAVQEVQQHSERRHQPVQAAAQRDPVLQRLDAQARQAVPMPSAVRERLASLGLTKSTDPTDEV